MCQELAFTANETAMHRSMSGREDVASFVHCRPAREAGRGPFRVWQSQTKNQKPNQNETHRGPENITFALFSPYRHAVPGIHLSADRLVVHQRGPRLRRVEVPNHALSVDRAGCGEWRSAHTLHRLRVPGQRRAPAASRSRACTLSSLPVSINPGVAACFTSPARRGRGDPEQGHALGPGAHTRSEPSNEPVTTPRPSGRTRRKVAVASREHLHELGVVRVPHPRGEVLDPARNTLGCHHLQPAAWSLQRQEQLAKLTLQMHAPLGPPVARRTRRG